MTGFVPVNFKQVGKIILIIGFICLIAKLTSYLTNWFYISNDFFYFGVALLLLSLYLIFVVPKP